MSITFISNNHERINKGIKSHVNNFGAFRGILITPLPNNFYQVSFEILEPPFYQFLQNFQMAPKIMRIIKDEPGLVFLRGIDENSDYGIKMNCNEEYISDITLYLLDRDDEIIYYNAEKKSNNTIDTEKIAIYRILELYKIQYDEEEMSSSLSLNSISRKLNYDLNENQIEHYLKLINSNEGRNIFQHFKSVIEPEDKKTFSMFSAQYEDAYYIEVPLNYLESLLTKYKQ